MKASCEPYPASESHREDVRGAIGESLRCLRQPARARVLHHGKSGCTAKGVGEVGSRNAARLSDLAHGKGSIRIPCSITQSALSAMDIRSIPYNGPTISASGQGRLIVRPQGFGFMKVIFGGPPLQPTSAVRTSPAASLPTRSSLQWASMTATVQGVAERYSYGLDSCGPPALALGRHNLERGRLFDADPGQRFEAV